MEPLDEHRCHARDGAAAGEGDGVARAAAAASGAPKEGPAASSASDEARLRGSCIANVSAVTRPAGTVTAIAPFAVGTCIASPPETPSGTRTVTTGVYLGHHLSCFGPGVVTSARTSLTSVQCLQPCITTSSRRSPGLPRKIETPPSGASAASGAAAGGGASSLSTSIHACIASAPAALSTTTAPPTVIENSPARASSGVGFSVPLSATC